MQRSWQALILTGSMAIFGCAGRPPAHIGVNDGHLAACPGSPNCVVSRTGSDRHFIDPFDYSGQRTEAMAVIRQVIQGMDGTRIATETDHYLHVTFESKWMGFVDDVEFYFPDRPVIHVRSASRVGYYDFGVNRRRMETIRTLFQARKSAD
ncbi:MAG: DUF1499 domain-containing protein [Desulfosarcina sp.]